MRDYQGDYAQWEKRVSYKYLNVYYIQFNSMNKQTQIIIATIDSFFCSFSSQNNINMKKSEYSPIDFKYNASQIAKI